MQQPHNWVDVGLELGVYTKGKTGGKTYRIRDSVVMRWSDNSLEFPRIPESIVYWLYIPALKSWFIEVDGEGYVDFCGEMIKVVRLGLYEARCYPGVRIWDEKAWSMVF